MKHLRASQVACIRAPWVIGILLSGLGVRKAALLEFLLGETLLHTLADEVLGCWRYSVQDPTQADQSAE